MILLCTAVCNGAASDRIAAAGPSLRPAVPPGPWNIISAPPAADSGRPPTAASPGGRSPMARSQLVGGRGGGVANRTPTSSTSAWAKPNCAATSCRATASTNPPTPARPGSTSGLADTQAISRIRINPTNPDIVYVAALGHPYGPNAERGVFRTQGWRRHLAEGPLSRRPRRRRRPVPRPAQPRRAVRRHLGRLPHAVEPVERRPAQRPFQIHRWRRSLDRDHAQSRDCPPASIGKIGVGDFGRGFQPRLRHRGKRKRRRVRLRRCRRHLEAGQRGSRTCASAPSTTPASMPIPRPRTPSTCSTSASTSPPTAARPTASFARRMATITTCGSTPPIRCA